MKTFAIVTLLAVTALTLYTITSSPRNSVEEQFYQFLETNRVGYSDTAEYEFRLGVFAKNLEKIAELNKANPLATFGVTKFADRTPEEMTKMMGLTGASAPHKTTHKVAKGDAKTVDWTNLYTHVKNQGQCGSCWAFSAIGCFEGRWALKQGQEQVTDEFSEQQLVDCDSNCYGCNGGLMDYAFEYLSTKGLCSESDYPYKAADETCADQDCQGPHTSSSTPFTDLDQDSDVIISELQNGPISVAVDASTWSYYQGGIVTHGCLGQLNHGVTLVAANVDDEDNQYVKIRNSWGGDWGEEGHIRLSVKDADCWTQDASVPNFE